MNNSNVLQLPSGDMTKDRRFFLTDSRDFIKVVLAANRLFVDLSLFDLLEKETVLECYSPQLEFVFASNSFFKASSYKYADLKDKNWSDLFVRDEISTCNILNAVENVKLTKSPKFNVIQNHLVSESYSEKRSVLVSVKAIYPLISLVNDEISALLAVVEFAKPEPV